MRLRWVLIVACCALFGCRPVQRGFEEKEPTDSGKAPSTGSQPGSPDADGGVVAEPTPGEVSMPGAPEPGLPEPGEPEAAREPEPSLPEPQGAEPSAEPGPGPVEPEPSEPSAEPDGAEPMPVEPEPTDREPEPGEPSAEPEPNAVEPAVEPDTLPEEPEPIGGCGEQLLRNGAFDLGDTAWMTSSSFTGISVIVAADAAPLAAQGVAPRSGEFLAWLGGVPDNEFDGHLVRLTQQLFIPEDATGLSFSGFVWIRTEEEDAGVPYDATYVDVTDLDGNVLWHPLALSNLDHAEQWVAFEETADEVPFAGTDVILELHSETDPQLVTSFWFDDLRLVVSCLR